MSYDLSRIPAVDVLMEVDSGNPAKNLYNLRSGPNYFRLGEFEGRPVKGVIVVKEDAGNFSCLFSKTPLNPAAPVSAGSFYTAVELGRLAGSAEMAGAFSDLESEQPATFGPLSEAQTKELVRAVMSINYEAEFRADAARHLRNLSRMSGPAPG